MLLLSGYKKSTVAPFMGAWIETELDPKYTDNDVGRTLHGCVD